MPGPGQLVPDHPQYVSSASHYHTVNSSFLQPLQAFIRIWFVFFLNITNLRETFSHYPSQIIVTTLHKLLRNYRTLWPCLTCCFRVRVRPFPSDIETTKRKLLTCETELKQNSNIVNLKRKLAAEKVMRRKLTFKVRRSPLTHLQSLFSCAGQ